MIDSEDEDNSEDNSSTNGEYESNESNESIVDN